MKFYPKVIFADLDDTLIRTASGKTFAEDPTDFRIRKDVLDCIRSLKEDYGLKSLFIVSNQGGIPEFISECDFETKMNSIKTFISGYIQLYCFAKWCSSRDPNNPRRKPNTGMLEEFYNIIQAYGITKDECMMIGDASGKPGDFSDSDKKTAENFGIRYMDVEEFVELYNGEAG